MLVKMDVVDKEQILVIIQTMISTYKSELSDEVKASLDILHRFLDVINSLLNRILCLGKECHKTIVVKYYFVLVKVRAERFGNVQIPN